MSKMLVVALLFFSSINVLAEQVVDDDGIWDISPGVKVLLSPSKSYIDRAERRFRLTVFHNGVDSDLDGVYELPRGTTTIIGISAEAIKMNGAKDVNCSFIGKNVSVRISRGIISPIPKKEVDDKGFVLFTYSAPDETVEVSLVFVFDGTFEKTIRFLLI